MSESDESDIFRARDLSKLSGCTGTLNNRGCADIPGATEGEHMTSGISMFLQRLNDKSDLGDSETDDTDEGNGTQATTKVNAALDHVVSILRGKLPNSQYQLDPSEKRMHGGQSVVAIVRHKHGGNFVAKFFSDPAVFRLELKMYCLLVRSHAQ